MNPRVKNAIYTLALVVAITLVWKFRSANKPMRLEGKTMGTTYHITYYDRKERDFQKSIDSLLLLVNRSINTYDSTSEISRFNKSSRSFHFELPYFFPPLKKSKEVVEGSSGAYDPTVMPLVNAWGFGPRKVDRPDTMEVQRLMAFVGFEKIGFDADSVWKMDPHVQLDFSAIGQGYGADVLADFFRTKGVQDFFVELGGEGVASGKNLAEGKDWEIGILDPKSTFTERRFAAYATLRDKAFTTSGNYFNFREIDGIQYSHTLDPHTGFPVRSELLSASVFAKDCATADAWATAFMSMGNVKAQQVLKEHRELDAFLIFSTANGLGTFLTDGMRQEIRIEP
jgi:thiamine biosynthesis lipoprotein